jgi:hypothetical protein
MGRSSLLGIEEAATEPAGRDVESLGPNDSSDTGSDSVGVPGAGAGDAAASDAAGTGEGRGAVQDSAPREAADIGVDRTFSAEAGPVDEDDGAEPTDERDEDTDADSDEAR